MSKDHPPICPLCTVTPVLLFLTSSILLDCPFLTAIRTRYLFFFFPVVSDLDAKVISISRLMYFLAHFNILAVVGFYYPRNLVFIIVRS